MSLKAKSEEVIFVSPEYLFTRQNTTNKREPLTEGHKEGILRDLKAISNTYKKVLNFPGTIFYEVALSTHIAFRGRSGIG